jgi:hypothetical protein
MGLDYLSAFVDGEVWNLREFKKSGNFRNLERKSFFFLKIEKILGIELVCI